MPILVFDADVLAEINSTGGQTMSEVLLDQGQTAAPSLVQWFFSSMGLFYTALLALSGLGVFVGACLVVALSRRPAVIAAYLVLLPLPVLVGVIGYFDGKITAYRVIAMSEVTPRPSALAQAESTALSTVIVGVIVSIPAYFVVAFGLLARTLAWRGSGDQAVVQLASPRRELGSG